MAGAAALAAPYLERKGFRNPQIDAEALIPQIEQVGFEQTANMLESTARFFDPQMQKAPAFQGGLVKR